MNRTRIQLTLFINNNDAVAIEIIREKYNPEQYQLIKSHVTLCREDELHRIEKVIENLSILNYAPICIHFGPATRFSDGKGVLIPATGDNEPFHKLRAKILKGLINSPREHKPHITLMHPRNSVCTDEIFEKIREANLPNKLTFNKICLIEQQEGKPWKILSEFELVKNY